MGIGQGYSTVSAKGQLLVDERWQDTRNLTDPSSGCVRIGLIEDLWVISHHPLYRCSDISQVRVLVSISEKCNVRRAIFDKRCFRF